jgi:hypothetical protein
LDVTLREAGTVLDFKRSVQVDGGKPMRLKLDIERDHRGGWLYAVLLCALGAMVVGRSSATLHVADRSGRR